MLILIIDLAFFGDVGGLTDLGRGGKEEKERRGGRDRNR